VAHIELGPFRVDIVEMASRGVQKLARHNRVYMGFEANGHAYFGFWDHLPRRLKFEGERRFEKIGLEHVVGRRVYPPSLGPSIDVYVTESTDGKTGLRTFSPTDMTEAWLFQFVDED
jgi:hypothetical protein